MMNSMFRIILVLIFFLLFQTTGHSQKINQVFIKNTTSEDLSLYYVDPKLVGGPIFVGAKNFNLQNLTEGSYLIAADRFNAFTKIFATDTIEVVKDTRGNINFKSSMHLNYSKVLNNLFFNTGSLKGGYGLIASHEFSSLKQREEAIEKIRIQRMSCFDSSLNNISDSSINNEILREINYTILIEKLDTTRIQYKNRFKKKFTKQEVYNFYKDSLSKFIEIINDDTNTTVCLQQLYLLNILLNFYISDTAINEHYDVVIDLFKGINRDALITKLLWKESQYNANNIELKRKLYLEALIKANVKSSLYAQMCNEILEQNSCQSNLVNKEDSLTTIYGATIPFAEVFKEKGYLYYVDFWASWCIPCLKEMPKSKELSKYFSGQKVKFIYISIDENKANWENSILNLSALMNKGNSFRLKTSSSATIVKKYKITSIPRYFLINTKGVIIDADAPEPSSKEIKQIIKNKLAPTGNLL